MAFVTFAPPIHAASADSLALAAEPQDVKRPVVRTMTRYSGICASEGEMVAGKPTPMTGACMIHRRGSGDCHFKTQEGGSK